MMTFFGFFNATTGAWLDNDFQSPHFADIAVLIAACYPSVEAFAAAHGAPESWEKKQSRWKKFKRFSRWAHD